MTTTRRYYQTIDPATLDRAFDGSPDGDVTDALRFDTRVGCFVCGKLVEQVDVGRTEEDGSVCVKCCAAIEREEQARKHEESAKWDAENEARAYGVDR